MKVDDILKLIDAGYTREEIKTLYESPQETPETPPVTVEPVEQVAEPAPAEKPDAMGVMASMMENYMKSMQETLKEIQKANIKNSSMPVADKDTAETALAAIITPTKKK